MRRDCHQIRRVGAIASLASLLALASSCRDRARSDGNDASGGATGEGGDRGAGADGGVDVPTGTGDGTGGGTGGSGGGVGTGGAAGATGVGPTLIGSILFSEPSQAFEGQLMVTMTTAVVGAEIRYTTDRSLPAPSSMLYEGQPIAVGATTQLRARAFKGGAPVGAVSTALYIQRDFDTTSDIPLIIVDGYGLGVPLDKDVYVDAAVMVFEPQYGTAKLSNAPTVAARAGWHVRGQSSSRFPQKPYRLELRDNDDRDLDYPMLGMPADSDWALIPPYRDRSLVRNPLVYETGRAMGLAAPRVRFAEVYINTAQRPVTKADYAGVYWLTETVKNTQNRLDLKQLHATDTALPALTGGYVMKFDWNVAEEPTIECTGSAPALSAEGAHCWTDLEVVDPEPLGPEQKAWLAAYVQSVHDSLQTTPLGGYASLLDVPSVVDAFIVSELTRNLDAYTRSTYYHKDRGGKLKAGPLWDYNNAIDLGRETNRNPEGWQYAGEPQTRRVGGSNWIPRLASDPTFMAAVAARWKELRQTVLSDAALDARITALTGPLTAAAERDSVRWPVAAIVPERMGPTAPTWAGQVQAVRDWLARRIAWLDSQFP